ncbi:MAG: pyrroloquinoline quinone biosynthesis peptide chaperone PqqD [Alphaproteobacteria bacterium]
MSEPVMIGETSVPAFPRGVRLKHDEVRTQWVILAPERMFVLDDIGLAIMQGVDGEATVSGIVDDLAEKFQAPREQILGDVIEMLQGFADKGVLAA